MSNPTGDAMANLGSDVIGGFPPLLKSDNCAGCGKSLELENAWMTDGCPCNSPLGINTFNETRWRLLMQLQQQQSNELAQFRKQLSEFVAGQVSK